MSASCAQSSFSLSIVLDISAAAGLIKYSPSNAASSMLTFYIHNLPLSITHPLSTRPSVCCEAAWCPHRQWHRAKISIASNFDGRWNFRKTAATWIQPLLWQYQYPTSHMTQMFHCQIWHDFQLYSVICNKSEVLTSWSSLIHQHA